MSKRTLIAVCAGIVATFIVVAIIIELTRPEPAPSANTAIVEATSPPLPSTTIPETTTTTTTTIPVATTTRPRPTTTTTAPEPEPQVQGEQAAVESDGGDDIEIWLAMGRCEQPGNEWGGVRWSHPGPTYQGGLGFWYGTWDSFKQGTSAAGIDNAGQATPMQQIEVARKIRDRYGYRAWGCARKIGV
jgi:hypothetical protein